MNVVRCWGSGAAMQKPLTGSSESSFVWAMHGEKKAAARNNNTLPLTKFKLLIPENKKFNEEN